VPAQEGFLLLIFNSEFQIVTLQSVESVQFQTRSEKLELQKVGEEMPILGRKIHFQLLL